jgi:hypothetical protein
VGAQRWTAPRRRALETYVSELAPLLRLADWTIRLDWKPAPDAEGESTLAMITPQPRKKAATLQLGETFLDLPAEQQTQVLCHELVHCHLFPTEELVRSTLTLLGEGEQRVAEIALEQQIEHATDALAEALAPLVPIFAVDVTPLPVARPRSAGKTTGRARSKAPARRPARPASPATLPAAASADRA